MSKLYEEKIRPNINEIVQLRAKRSSLDEISSFLGIAPHDLELAIYDNTDLYNAWYKGEVYLVGELEKALYRVAIGHYVEEEEKIESIDSEGKMTKTVKKKKKWVQSVPAALKALEVINKTRWAGAGVSNNEIEIILPSELIEYSE